MKKLFHKRWLGNLLIVLFGLVILFVTGLVTYKSLFFPADTTNVFVGNGTDTQFNFSYSPETILVPDLNYNIVSIPAAGTSFKFLEIYDTFAVANAFGSGPTVDSSTGNTLYPKQHPAYELPYIKDIDSEGNTQISYMAIVPLPTYNYTYGRIANTSSAAYKLLSWAQGVSGGSNTERGQLATAVSKYEAAAKLATSNFVIDGNQMLTTKDPSILSQCPDDVTACDPDVQSAIMDADPGQDYYNAFKISADPNFHYQQPKNDSLTLKIFDSALENAQLDSVQDTTSVAKINAAKANYQRQIQGNSTSGGLTLSSVSTIQHNESQSVNFSMDISALVLPSGATLQTLLFNIDEKTFCTIHFSGDSNYADSNNPGCLWNTTPTNHVYSGVFTWDQNTGQGLGTGIASTGSGRVLMLKSFSTASGNNTLASVSKNVIVLPGTGDVTTPGGGVVPMSVTVPESVDKSNHAVAAAVPIKISASNLNPNGVSGANRVGKISWYVCKGDQQTITANDSGGCEPTPRDSFGPFVQNSFSDKPYTWDASSATAGSYVIMVKAYGLKLHSTDTEYPPYPGATKVVSSTITVVDSMPEGGGGGGEDGGGSITPGWAANFQKSSAKTIDDILKIIGPFSLYILGFLAVIAIIMAGMKYITSGGDPKGAEAGKKSLLFAIYGIIAAVLCVMLVRTTISEVQKIIGNSLQAPAPGETGTILSTQFGGPNASVSDIIGQESGLIWHIIQLLVYYAEVVAVFYILYASFLYLTAYGDDSKAESAKKTIIWAVIGMAFILSANVLLNIFGQVLK